MTILFYATSGYFWQFNLPSSLFPSINLEYIEDKYLGLSTQAPLNAWSSLQGKGGATTETSDFNESRA